MDPLDLRLWRGFKQAGGSDLNPVFIDQISLDSRRIVSPNTLFVALEGTLHDGHKFIQQAAKAGAKFALVRKGWQPVEPIDNIQLLHVDCPLSSFQEIAQTYREQLPTRFIGIVGSFGKTMVKDLLYSFISKRYKVGASPESFNSQIGVPLSLLTIKKEHEYAIIEAGISEIGDMDPLVKIINPDYAILTHVGKKHLATMGNIHNAAREMSKLLINPKKDKWIVIPQDANLTPHLDFAQAESWYWNEDILDLPHAKALSNELTQKMPYRIDFPDGKHFVGEITSGHYYFLDLINITIKAAWLLGISSEQISETLQSFTPEPMRTEIWKSPIGTTFINDIYCSDPQSVDQSLKYFDQYSLNNRKVFVFGGMKQKRQHINNDYQRIGKAIHRSHVDLLLLYGPHDFTPLIDEVKKQCPQIEITQFAQYSDAVNQMRAHIKSDDIVLIKGENKEPFELLTETFNDSISNNQCIINLAAIRTNIDTIRNKLPPQTKVMVIVKALAYGTDDIRMSKFLETCGVNTLGVSYVDEGVALKRAGVNQSIFVINAAYYEAAKVVKWDFEVGVSEKALIEAIAEEAAKQNKKIKIHLHVDTGMSRFGCRPEEALELTKLIYQFPSLIFEGIMTHFACSDNPQDDPFTLKQAKTFDDVIENLESHGFHPTYRHAANSSGAIRFNFPQYNMVRLGLAVYGLYTSEATKEAMELHLALSLVSRIVGINTCKSGETISYGRTYTVNREFQKIAVLPIGYFDGLHRNYSGKSHVLIRGHKASMVGRICMDFMMVDVSDIPNVSIGDPVLIFGEDEFGQYLSPEDLATRGDSIVHELITCLGPRIQRIFVYEEAHHLR